MYCVDIFVTEFFKLHPNPFHYTTNNLTAKCNSESNSVHCALCIVFYLMYQVFVVDQTRQQQTNQVQKTKSTFSI